MTGAGFVILAATLSVVPSVPVAGMALILGIDRFMSECRALTNFIGNAVATIVVSRWENELDSEALARKAAEQGILIEPGRINFGAADPPRNYFRLAFSSIDEKHIEPGIRLLAQKIAEGERSSRQPSGDR